MKMSEVFPATLFNVPRELEDTSRKFLHQSGIVRFDKANVAFFSMGNKVLIKMENILQQMIMYLNPIDFVQQASSLEYIKREITSEKQLPLFFYNKQNNGLNIKLIYIQKKDDQFYLNKDITNWLSKLGLNTANVWQTKSHFAKVFKKENEKYEYVYCPKCGFAADINFPLEYTITNQELKKQDLIKKVFTPNIHTIKELCSYLNISEDTTVKTLIYSVYHSSQKYEVAALIKGSRNISDKKLAMALGAQEVKLADVKVTENLTGAPLGFAGPCNLKGVKIIADYDLINMANMVVGANQKDYHYINVNIERDFKVDMFFDLKQPLENDPCPKCGGKLKLQKGMPLATLKSLNQGDKLIETVEVNLLNTIIALAENNHDENGLIWPESIAPFEVIVIPVKPNDKTTWEWSYNIYEELKQKNVDVIIDDRQASPGVKFKDADLIGFPYRIVIGPKSLKNHSGEIKVRKTGKLLDEEIKQLPKKLNVLLSESQNLDFC